ncbi:MAG: ribosomal protein S18-alanine N-acetyltransferase [Dehalococcoidales bacterium]
MSYYVRPMHREDIPQVNEIDRDAFASQWPPPNYLRELQNKLARHVVACDNARVIPAPETRVPPRKGISGLTYRLRELFNNGRPTDRQFVLGFAGIWVLADEAHITNIAVRSLYQRKGIGELLLISIIDFSVALKASVVTLEVRVSNEAAQSLYRKYGFNEVGLRHGYYTDNRENAVIMTTEGITSAAFRARLKRMKLAYARRYGASIDEMIFTK